MHTLFDIMAERDQCVILGNLWGVKMVNEDFELHKNMSQFLQIGYCSIFVIENIKLMLNFTDPENRRLMITNPFKL